jgi:hypothetical protein
MVYLFCGLTIISLCSGESERGADIHVENNIFSEAPASCTPSHTMTPGCLLSMYLFSLGVYILRRYLEVD